MVHPFAPDFYSPEINKALVFAAIAHLDQNRKGTEIPYITHPYAVGMILARSGYPDSVIIAGILHDCVEDTVATLDDIRAEFGDDVAAIVNGCSEPDKELPWEERKQHTIDELKLAQLGIQLVACADKLHNISSMIEDYNKIGEEFWKRFNRDKDQQHWYYREFVKCLEDSEVSCHELYKQLGRSVKLLFEPVYEK